MSLASKKNPALQIISAILLAITFSLSILSVGLWWTLLRGGAAGDISRSAVADPEVQRGLAVELLNKFAEGADPETAAVISEKRADLELALDKVLADPATSKQISDIANSVADALASDRGTVSVDVRPILTDALNALNTELGNAKVSDSDLADMKPIVLGEDSPLPNLSATKTLATTLAAVSVLLAIGFGFLYFVFTRRRSLSFAIFALAEGAIFLLISLLVPSVANSQVGEGLANSIAGVVVSKIFSGPLTLSILSLVAGAALMTLHIIKSRKVSA
ncbi:MAG: hypothetical protein F2664_06930 [Actinobacteria bacterium]|uniref:Unannotated protein n=1 Tax=freshwater metagenome TaxID=449393 RepID=A0A6J7VKF4_9ZZZZ|nr:hypothetical protein [Actinomycetota bacterium]MTA51109.1 hypothetical protein [Actinomycetota bacterium]